MFLIFVSAKTQAQEKLLTLYTRGVPSTDIIMWYDSAATVGGVATLYLTSNGLESGTALFADIYSVNATARAGATIAVNVPFCGVRSISADRKTIKINVVSGVVVAPPAIGISTTSFVPDGTMLYLTIIGK